MSNSLTTCSNQSDKLGSKVYQGMLPLFRPRSIAVVGATADPTKIGGLPVAYLLKHGYAGPIYPINPKHDTIQGLKAYESITAIPHEVDQVIMAVSAKLCVPITQACADKGVKSMVMFTSGFAEMDEEGATRQRQITAIARKSGMRILGPNCLGMFSAVDNVYSTFSSTLSHGLPKPGNVGIASQSGAFGAHCFVMARERGLGLSHWVTTGNECDISFADCVRFLAEDPQTQVILGYMEGCKDVAKLQDAFAYAHRMKKPVILMKVGGSEVGAAAAASHTAAITGSDDAFNALFKQYNVTRAVTAREMIDMGYACSLGLYPKSRRLGIITVSGGAGALMADAAEQVGLDVAPMSAKAQARLKKLLPFSSPRNPVDVTGSFYNDWSLLRSNFEAMLDEGNYGSIIGFFTSLGYSEKLVDNILEQMAPLRRQFADRLIVFSVFGTPANIRKIEEEGILCFGDPTDATLAVAAMARIAEGFKKPLPRKPKLGSDIPRVPAQVLSEYDAKKLLKKAGVPSPDELVATSPAQAAKLAAQVGFPVVMKILSRQITHKTEVGGVVLGVESQAQARKAYTDIITRSANAVPDATIDGVLVCPMIRGGVETILGVFRDPVLGPVVMFGLGGVFAETLKDVTFRLAPFDEKQGREMALEIKGSAILLGARGKPPADIDAIAKALSALSLFAAANADTLESVDINPFVVFEQGKGAAALDALIIPR